MAHIFSSICAFEIVSLFRLTQIHIGLQHLGLSLAFQKMKRWSFSR